MAVFLSKTGRTPLGFLSFTTLFPQGSREARQPWAKLSNRFAVGSQILVAAHKIK